ncbi:MAG: XdhC family protein, partial [Alphaproteobacteria bacterium]
MFATINLTKVKGSAPRSAGTRMVVSPDEQWGTIGGGELEFSCVNLARKSISTGKTNAIEFDQALGPNLGQCCGGSVKICIEFHDEKPELQHQTNSHVSLFGAG